MHSDSDQSSSSNRPSLAKPMRANEFDLVSSGLTAIMVWVGCAVLVLFSIWITDTQLIPETDGSYPETRLVSASSSSTAGLEFEQPTVEETVALREPTLQQIVQQVESVELAIVPDGQSEVLGQSETLGEGASVAGPAGEDLRESTGVQSVPLFQRWHLMFTAANQAEFARQLDALGIELGAFGGDVQGIDYARRLSTQVTRDHNSRPETEKRLYFSWSTPSPLATFERALLAQAGVRIAGRQIVKFLPADLEKQFVGLELAYFQAHGAQANGVSKVDGIQKTVFQCQADGPSFRFVVIDQRYVNAR